MRPVGQIGDVRHAEERRHVVLAMALDADVAQHDEIVIAAGLVEGPRQHLGGIRADSREDIPRRRR